MVMDEIWERAVETALDGENDVASVRTLTLDGAVKCVHGRLPPPSLLEKFQNLQHLSIANIGVSSLEHFPRLRNLQKLILSDNRISGGLEFLVQAGLHSLRDLDLSNNRIGDINDLGPLAHLRLVSLDLYECPITRVKDYRARVFGLIGSLKYLDKMDDEENERPESDDDEDEEEEGDDDEEDDPGSGEVDGEDRPSGLLNNGHRVGSDGVVDVDEDEESDADEEETEILGGGVNNGLHNHSNGFRVEVVGEEEEDEEENVSVEEIDEEDGDDDDEDVVEVHEIEDSDDEEDGVEDEDEYEDGDDVDDEEEVDNDEVDFGEPESTGRLMSTEGEIDGHEQGEDDGDDDDGETGEEELGVEEDVDFEDGDEAEDEEEDYGRGYVVQPVRQGEEDAGGSDMDRGDEDEDPEVEEVDNEDQDGEVQELPPSSTSRKRKRDEEDEDEADDEDDDTVH